MVGRKYVSLILFTGKFSPGEARSFLDASAGLGMFDATLIVCDTTDLTIRGDSTVSTLDCNKMGNL